VAGFWTTLAKMLVSPTDRVALSHVRGYPVRFIVRPLESWRRDLPKPASFSLLCRNPCPGPLLHVCFIVPASEASATAPARQDQISFVHPRSCRNCGELGLPLFKSYVARNERAASYNA
jgi:hypothetical protein